MAQLDVLNQEITDAGAWVFTGGLHPASASTVLRFTDGDVLTTDGPYAEGAEHLGDFWIITAPDQGGRGERTEHAGRIGPGRGGRFLSGITDLKLSASTVTFGQHRDLWP